MATTPANRRKRANRRSGFDRRWITSAYNGPERRKGTDRRRNPERRRTGSRLAPLGQAPSADPEQEAAALPAPEQTPGDPDDETGDERTADG